MPTNELNLSIYGATVRVRTSSQELLAWLRFDFCYFLSTAAENPALDITAELTTPPWEIVPEIVESMRSTEFVCFDQGSKRYVNYFGHALVVFDYQAETAQMYSDEPDYLYEKLYLLILSRTGEALDRRGVHRVHALGISHRNRAALFLMPSGGGKSTLALSLLKDPEVSLLSEDTPLITGAGQVLPFPLRLGISQEQIPADAPPELVRVFHRSKWGTKYLLHIDYFRSKIQHTPTPLRFLFSGAWINSRTPKIVPVSRLNMTCTLMRDCVFGLGLPQIIEFFLTSNKIDLLRKTGIAFRRIITVLRSAWRCRCFRIYLSKDIEANKLLLLNFLRDEKQ